MAEPSPGTASFLAATIGSTDVAAADMLYDRESLLRHAAARVRQEIDLSGGTLQSAGGGQVVVVYERPALAILAAIALAAAFPPADGEPSVNIRLALHIGPAPHTTPIETNSMTPALAYLGQLLFVSRPGQILLSDAMTQQFRAGHDALPPGVGVRGVGLLNQRDGSDPTRVFQIVITAPATPTTTPPSTDADSLPPPASVRRKRQASQVPPRKRAGTDPEQFRVYTLGRFHVQRGATEVELANSQGLKGLQLFKCLLSRPSRRIPRDQAYEQFWPDSPRSKVDTTFRTNVKRLRDLLEPDVDAHASILQYTPEIVSIRSEPPVWVDADEFERLIQEARHAVSPDPLLEAADRLWQGEYLPDDLYHDWAAPRRAELGRLWTELQFEVARRREVRGDEHGAEAALQKLLAADPTDEHAARELMLLHGRRSDALTVYQRLEEPLSRDLHIEPTTETQTVRQKVTAGEIEPSPAAASAPAPDAVNGGADSSLAPFSWPATSQAGPAVTPPDGQQPPARPDATPLRGQRARTAQPAAPATPQGPPGSTLRADGPTTRADGPTT